MKIVFVSNMLNHHSLPLCQAFSELCDDFKFVATVDSSGDGYQHTKEADFVIKAFNDRERAFAEKCVIDADFVIFGANSEDLLKKRMETEKTSFLYSERLFKKGFWQKYIPRTRKRLNENIVAFKNKKLYVLCASAYLPMDLESIGFPASRCYKWGYFPESSKTDWNRLVELKNKNDCLKIIWVGRLIELKHPEYVVRLANRLRENGFCFKLDVVGDGPMRSGLERIVNESGLESIVSFLGTKKTEEVREYMKCSDVFLFTSDFNEGWGAVLNEAMDSGCACVASHAPGSSAFLLQHGINGLLFQSLNFDDFYHKVEQIISNKDKRTELSRNAYLSMKDMWNARIAAERLIDLYNHLLNDEESPFLNGPCSKAEVLKNNWYKGG